MAEKQTFVPVNFYRNSFSLVVKDNLHVVYRVNARTGYAAKCDLREYLNVQGIMVTLDDIMAYVEKD